ncbi:MAG: phosphoribosylamine--glycine ligase [Pseudomonadota bacterium]
MQAQKVLIVGGGGREHALAWKAAQSPSVTQVYVAPGNAGTANEPNIENINIAAEDIEALKKFAREKNIDLTIVGPEVPLVQGIVDTFQGANLKCFGPSAGAAQLEGSKAFTKAFLAKYEIPTAAYDVFTDSQAAKDYVAQQGTPIVIKADGLAAGKGVIIAQTQEEAYAAIDDMLSANKFGDAGSRVVIEEFLQGEEASFIVMADGKNFLPFATSQDHKARDNGDQGPNTGGMGAYSPAPVVTPEIHETTIKTVIEPTLKAMTAEGYPFTGFLYAGLMIDAQGQPKVLEFNCRFGDPETQPIMMRLESDLVELCLLALEQKLDSTQIKFSEQAALGVVMAAGGYPEAYAKGNAITGLDTVTEEEAKVFHAGTRNQEGQIVTAGGRVICVTALGDNVSSAQKLAYQNVSKIQWQDVFYRTDIGYRALTREQQ